ncbi:hypothetical protein L9F63_013464, partial [Diploptera punctata]
IFADISMHMKVFFGFPRLGFKFGLWPLIPTFRHDPTCHYQGMIRSSHRFRSYIIKHMSFCCGPFPKTYTHP